MFKLQLTIGLLLLFSFQLQAQNVEKKKPVKSATINLQLESAKVDTFARKQKESPNRTILPLDLKLPKNAKIIKQTNPLIDSTKEVKVIIKNNKDDKIQPMFPGLGDNGTSIPPDLGAAVGPNHLMTALNTQVRIQDKTGTNLSTISLNGFFSSLGGSPNMFDPKVLYDPFHQRWLITAPANSAAANSSLMIGVSATNDPTGTWQLYQFDVDGTNVNWFDYPSFGFNRNWVVVTGNLFRNSDNAYSNAIVFVFDKMSLYNSIPPTPSVFNRPASDGNTFCPAITLDNTTNIEYLVSSFNSSNLRIYTITGTAGAPIFTATSTFISGTPWSSSPNLLANFAPQSGSPALIQNNDHRMQNAVFRNNSLWCTHNIFLPAGGTPTRSGIQWWQLNPVAGTIIQNGRIQDPTNTNFFAFPTIAVNTYDDMLIGYSSFSATQFASCNFSFRLNSDPLNTTHPISIFHSGLAPYNRNDGTGRNRWGDYSSTCIDPDDNCLWTLQEYAEFPVSGVSRWGTFWNKWCPPRSDLYSKDLSTDLGAEPNPLPGHMYQSPDIWIRKNQDAALTFAHIHENAEYRIGTSNPNYVYVEVHNRGTIASSGTETLSLYWAKAGAGLGWQAPWTGGIFYGGDPTMLMGNFINTQTIPVIPAGGSSILEFAWNPPDPGLYAVAFGTEQNHFCLLSRITSSATSPFGMTYPETGALWANVVNNNNIAWKNISVLDMLPGSSSPLPGVVMISNFTKKPNVSKLVFEVKNDIGVDILTKGELRVTPKGILAKKFKKLKLFKSDKIGEYIIYQKNASINKIPLNPNEMNLLEVRYLPNQTDLYKDEYTITVTQYTETKNGLVAIGGQTFVKKR